MTRLSVFPTFILGVCALVVAADNKVASVAGEKYILQPLFIGFTGTLFCLQMSAVKLYHSGLSARKPVSR